MNNPSKQSETPKSEQTDTSKSGFFSRLFTKLDKSMQIKADQKAQNGCCSGSDGKGGKCC